MPTRNLIALYIIKISKWFMLYMPISFLFYMENSFSEFEYLTLHAIYSGVIALFEVPSGYIADVWGRKKAIIGGTVFGALGFSVYSSTEGLFFFLVAEILLGIGSSLLSGADTAMLYDTLLENKKEKSYLKHEGYITALGNFSEVMAAVFVSLIIFSTYRDYFILQTLIACCGIIAALFLREPVIHGKKLTGSFTDIIKIIFYIFRENKKLGRIILFSSAIGFASLSMAWLAQPLLKAMGINADKFGYSWAALNLLVTIGSFMAPWIATKLSFKQSLIFMAVPLSLAYFVIAMSLSMWALIPLVIFFFIRGTAHPILKKYINDSTSSEKRATVMSVRSLIIRMMFLVLGPLLGVITEKISLETAVLFCGAAVLIPAAVLFYIITKKQ